MLIIKLLGIYFQETLIILSKYLINSKFFNHIIIIRQVNNKEAKCIGYLL